MGSPRRIARGPMPADPMVVGRGLVPARRPDGRRAGACPPPGLVSKTLPAAAGVLGAGVVELEPRALQPDDVIDADTLQVHRAHRVDKDLEAVLLVDLIAVLGRVLEVHRVLEARATPAHDADADAVVGQVLAGHRVAYHLDRLGGEADGAVRAGEGSLGGLGGRSYGRRLHAFSGSFGLDGAQGRLTGTRSCFNAMSSSAAAAPANHPIRPARWRPPSTGTTAPVTKGASA